ncbi:MAG: DUF1732 domain-containing protein [Nitrospirae bacterium]|nr:DUF1732 domain-containing protein [Nitrospirota bacterium]
MTDPVTGPISSMTGYAESLTANGYRIQLRSYNHRSLEIVLRIPPEWEGLEPSLRKTISQHLSRGRVDTSIHRTEGTGKNLSSFLENGVRAYRNLTLLNHHLGLARDVEMTHILQMLAMDSFAESPPLDERVALDDFSGAVQALVRSRTREGQALAQLLRDFIASIRSLADQMEGQKKTARKEIRRKFLERMKSYLREIEGDPGKRFEEEALLYLAKKDNEEEWKRFHIHLAQAERELEKGGLLGRSLDFLAQEMNRELTTFISKEPSPELFQPAMEIRNILSSFREQIQNLE